MNPWLKSFRLDLRSLALGRIFLGGIATLEFLFALARRDQYYTEDGVLPRSALARMGELDTSLSLYLASSWTGFTVFLLFASLLCAVSFTLGWKTRISTVLLWLAVVALQERNSWILIGGDAWLRVTLFWLMFLPCGHFFSLDSRRGQFAERPNVVANAASIGLILQVVYIYLWAGGAKYGPDWWEGTTISYVLQSQEFGYGLAEILLYFPVFLSWVSKMIPWLEILSGLFMVLPFKSQQFRLLGVGTMMVMHLGIWTCMDLYHFSAIALGTLTLLLPSLVWKRTGLPEIVFPSDLARPLTGFLLFITLGTLLYNPYRYWRGDKLSPAIFWTGEVLGLSQRWQLFAPTAPKSTQIYYAVAKLKDGTEQHLSYRGWKVSAPPGPKDPEFEVRLSRYWRTLRERPQEYSTLYYAAWYSRVWSRRYPDQADDLRAIHLYSQEYPVSPDFEDLPPFAPTLVCEYRVGK